MKNHPWYTQASSIPVFGSLVYCESNALDHVADEVDVVSTDCFSLFNDGRQMDLLNMGGTIPVNFKVFSNGAKKKLAQLVGIIPVTFKGNVYNIPVCIWLMDTHPNNAPMCYVKPTPDMQIKASMFVDQSGKIYLPYLHEWSPSSSDLLGLIQIMIVTFSDQPPVYARSRTNIAATTPYPTQSYMPVPANSGPSSGNPPYPTTYHNYPSYPAANSSGFPPYPTNFYNYGSAGYPQYPPYPQTSQPNTSSPQNNSQTGTITEEHIRASLLSAVEDKLRRKMVEKLSQGQAELDTHKQDPAGTHPRQAQVGRHSGATRERAGNF
ncbi:unnamed protein product [Timema podura]|uniref:UEV domain-containing protein n=1 Tax=Timema podura TaxID=61482 RepID=A0ABN7NRH5_TIMPD|nr:unnamed protein product [Timema podura]